MPRMPGGGAHAMHHNRPGGGACYVPPLPARVGSGSARATQKGLTMDPAQVWHLMNDPQLQEWGTVIPMHPGLVALVDTGDNNVHHPYTAYNQGWEAFNAGYPAEANPYAYNPATRWLADWWETGWMGMEEDDDEDFGVLVDDNDETRDDD